MRISVIVPVWNRQATIGRALESIGQRDAAPFEVIVVDDGSTDGSADEAESRISALHPTAARVIRQPNAGPGAARNTGVRNAAGDYLAFLDSDDFWLEGTLELARDAIAANGEPALVFLQTVDLPEGAPKVSREELARSPKTQVFAGFLEAVAAVGVLRYASCNVIVRRDVFEQLGGFTTATRCSEDTDFFLRAAQMGPCLLVTDRPMVAHVMGRPDNLSGDFRAMRRGLDFLLAQDRADAYPEGPTGPPLKDGVLAKSVAHTVLQAFAAGEIASAYGLLLLHGRILRRGRNWHWLLRLPMLPLLAALKPSSFVVRRRARQGASGH